MDWILLQHSYCYVIYWYILGCSPTHSKQEGFRCSLTIQVCLPHAHQKWSLCLCTRYFCRVLILYSYVEDLSWSISKIKVLRNLCCNFTVVLCGSLGLWLASRVFLIVINIWHLMFFNVRQWSSFSRTTVGRGILALIQGADVNNWVLLTLEDNRNIRLYYNWGGNKKELVTSVPGNVRLNDAEWHKVIHCLWRPNSVRIFVVKGKLPPKLREQ